MNLLLFLGVFLAGGTGSWCRFRLDSLIKKHWRSATPIGTFSINLLGSLGLGLLTGALAASLGKTLGADSTLLSTLLGLGLLGGFSTFSTAMVEVSNQARATRIFPGLFLLLGQATLALAVAALGFLLGSNL